MLVLILSIALMLQAAPAPVELARGCSGDAQCSACKNCSGCKHCAKDGGTCGVCKRSKGDR